MLLRNGLFLPNLKCSLCSVKWMMRVKDGRYWVPKIADVRHLNCADPPLKAEVLDQLIAFSEDMGRKLGITIKRQPDKRWALQMLAHLKPTHKFFRKDYVPKKMADKLYVDDDHGFLRGLPPPTHNKRRRGGIFKEPESQKLKRQLALG